MLFATLAVVLAARSSAAEVLDKTKNVAGTEVHYKVVLPNGYDPAKGLMQRRAAD